MSDRQGDREDMRHWGGRVRQAERQREENEAMDQTDRGTERRNEALGASFRQRDREMR